MKVIKVEGEICGHCEKWREVVRMVFGYREGECMENFYYTHYSHIPMCGKFKKSFEIPEGKNED